LIEPRLPLISLLFLWILAVPAVGSSAYLLAMTLFSARLRPPPRSMRRMRFDVIIPAHNEETGIAGVIHSLLAIDWPTDCFRVVVVADNCTDATAKVAAHAGAQVLVRQDTELRGKGYALAYAFQDSRKRHWADAVAIIDADSRVSPNLLEAMAARLERGEQAVQVHYGVSNIHASWRTRLMAIALAAFHKVRSRARERLGLSCGIRGNGWGLTHALLEQVPFERFSLTEDVDYGIDLGMRGVRIAYADEARCDGEMVSGGTNARSQRRRWEQGRMAILRSRLLPLLKRAMADHSLVCLDLALDLLVLPLSYVALNAAALTVAGWLLTPAGSNGAWFWLGPLCCAALVLYVLRGWQLSNTGMRGLLDLLRAPFFLLWKLAVMFRRQRSTEWVRTNREGK
jgi:cellulose synthase/poly-beta-1,6-N-acetylglucosamine synthase-like glycosyltransferase